MKHCQAARMAQFETIRLSPIVIGLLPVILFVALYESIWGVFFPSSLTLALESQLGGVTEIRVFRYADRQTFTIPAAETTRFINSLRVSGVKESLLAHDLKATYLFYRHGRMVGTLWYISDGSFRWLKSKQAGGTQNFHTALLMRPGTLIYLERLGQT